MRLIWAILVSSILSSAAMAQTNSQTANDSAIEKDLTRIAQELLDAVGSGDKAVWEKYVADDVIYTDENWTILTKKQLVDSLAPLPKGYSGSIRVTDVQSRIHGDSAVLSYRALEVEQVFGQTLSPTYFVTDTYFKRNGRWQMVASHLTVRPSERKSMAPNPKAYTTIAGEYELTSGVIYTITVEDTKLMGQRTGRAKEELLPADDNTFFARGSIRGEKVFVRDANGRVTQMLDRRENNDLVWKRVR